MKPISFLYIIGGIYFAGKGIWAIATQAGVIFSVFGLKLNNLVFGAIYIVVGLSFFSSFWKQYKMRP